MFLKKSALILALTALLILLAFFVPDACAQWLPGGTVVYMGDLNLAGNMGQSGSGVFVIGSSGSQGSSSSTGGLGNLVSLGNLGSPVSLDSSRSPLVNDASTEEPQALLVVDLSSYAKDRTDKNLVGYTNIMYPLTESAGFIGTTSGGGGGGGGCGCGG